MLIYDFSQALYGGVYSLKKNSEINKENFRAYLLCAIIKVHLKFNKEHGKDIVLALDGPSWRKDVFSYYKHKRKKKREDEDVDWNNVFEIFEEIIQEFKENLPYKIIKVDGAEGDDILAILSKLSKQNVILVGVDKDYEQLQMFDHIKQYNPIKETFMEFQKQDIPYNLFSLISRGDTSDGICSIINPNDCFAKNIRQKPLREVYIKEAFEAAKKGNLENFLGKNVYKRFEENRQLIDFRYIPEEIQKKVVDKYINYPKKKNNLVQYIIDNNLNQFTSDVMKL